MTRRFSLPAWLGAGLLASAACALSPLAQAQVPVPARAADPVTSAPVDINRYAGTWYEIARMPHFFQRQCARDVTATYTRDGDAVRVVNRCVKADGEPMVAEGRAWVLDAPQNRRLEVGFVEILGWWPFRGDYHILALDPGYRWVIVGGGDVREYGWVLARDRVLDAATRAQIDARLQALGFDLKTFAPTVQTVPAPR